MTAGEMKWIRRDDGREGFYLVYPVPGWDMYYDTEGRVFMPWDPSDETRRVQQAEFREGTYTVIYFQTTDWRVDLNDVSLWKKVN